MDLKVKNIVLGHINEVFNLNQDISKARLKICYSCLLYSKKLGGMCNNKLWMNPITQDVSTEPKEGYYRGCGCRINAKTRLPNESCPLDKW